MSEQKNLRAIVAAVVFLMVASLACGPISPAAAPTITITEPATGTTVAVGETVQIVSSVDAPAGVARVELAVNGQVVRTDSPPAENPASFAVSQPWIPVAEGQVTVSVVAYDAKGQKSEPATISLAVVKEATQAEETPEPQQDGKEEEPESTHAPEITTEAGCILGAVYLSDVTIPDNTELAPGSAFVKTWRVRNSGTCDWEAGFELVFSEGAQLGGPASVALPALAAGARGDVSVDLVAPEDPGSYKGRWRFRATDGTIFGQSVTVVIVVPGAEEPTATPSATPTLTPSPTWTPTVTPTFGLILTPVLTAVIPVFLPYTEHVYTQVTVPANDVGYTTATCPEGSVVVSGGFAHGSAPDMFVYSHRMLGNGWRAYAKNDTGSSQLLNVYAVCLRNTAGTVTQVYQQVTAPANDIGHPVAACPSGSVVTGGGWAVQSDHSLHVYNSSKSGNGWQVYAKNTTASDEVLNVYAICLSNTGGATAQLTNQVSIGANTSGTATNACGDDIVTGGGFAGGTDLYVYNTSKSTSDEAWFVAAKNTAASSKLLNVYSICLSFP